MVEQLTMMVVRISGSNHHDSTIMMAIQRRQLYGRRQPKDVDMYTQPLGPWTTGGGRRPLSASSPGCTTFSSSSNSSSCTSSRSPTVFLQRLPQQVPMINSSDVYR